MTFATLLPEHATAVSPPLLIEQYNTRIALLGAGCLGAAAGLVGTFLVLRRRAPMADTLGHGTLPGIGVAFVVLVVFGGWSGEAKDQTNADLSSGRDIATSSENDAKSL